MARITLQIKNVASLLLATAASVCWGLAARRFFDAPRKSWIVFAFCGVASLGCQLGLIFVESKEEEELSLLRRQRLAELQHVFDENAALSERIKQEILFGDPESTGKWMALRRDRYGK